MKLLSCTFVFGLFFVAVSASFWSFFQAPIGQSEDLEVPGDNPLKFCQDPDDHILSIDKADLTPSDLKPGANVTLKITGDLDAEIKNGSTVLFQVKIKTAAGAVPVISETTDLCEQLDKKCPIDEGSVTFKKNVSIPAEVPKATYLLTVDASNKDDKRITCVEAEVTFE